MMRSSYGTRNDTRRPMHASWSVGKGVTPTVHLAGLDPVFEFTRVAWRG